MAHLSSAVGEVTQAPYREPCGGGECAIAVLRYRGYRREELVMLEGKNAKAAKAILQLRTGDRCVAFGRLKPALPASPYHHCLVVRDVSTLNEWRLHHHGQHLPTIPQPTPQQPSRPRSKPDGGAQA